jgi:AGZA family xanthine/uracil permease-like MFS transporter
VTGVLFLPFLFISPIIGMVPAQATAPALIIVGWLMISVLTEAEEEAEPGTGAAAAAGQRKFAGIDFHDLAIGLAAALTIMIMPFTFSIANGIGFGFIAYVIVRAAQGEWRRVHPFMWISAAAFTLYFLVPLLQDNLSWI